ncbi:MAG TPA: methyltransferase domain-containing protein [Usitatibacter sp.]
MAPPFLEWLDVPAGKRWLDVGCGTGALSAAILDQCFPSSVEGVEPSEGFLKTAKENLGDRAALHQGSATAIPLGDSSVDVVVSGLVLNFIPDPHAAIAEMARVTGDGGTIAAYVWDYAGRMELMRHFWDAAADLDPDAAKLDEGVRFPLCTPMALADLFAGAGLEAVDVEPIDIETPFENFDDYWQPFLGGQGPAPAYAMSLDEAARSRLRERIKARLPVASDGSILLRARAWAARGKVAG